MWANYLPLFEGYIFFTFEGKSLIWTLCGIFFPTPKVVRKKAVIPFFGTL